MFCMTQPKHCEKCDRKITRTYRGHNVCEFHYLEMNPNRNAVWVLRYIRDNPPWTIDDRILLLKKVYECLSLEEIEKILDKAHWYQRLREEGKFP